MEELNLKQIVEQYPDCLHNSQKLKGIILDLYPACPRGLIRVIVDIAESSFFKEIQLGLEVSDLKKSSWVSHLENEVGCSPKLAISALNIWLNVFEKSSSTEIKSDDDIFEQALEFYDDGQHEKAVDLFLLLAEQGHIEAQCFLASCYENGEGVPVDQEEAAKWYCKAAEQGDADAQYCLASCYAKGKGVSVDEQEAAKWYRKAAEQGNADAQNWLEQWSEDILKNTAKDQNEKISSDSSIIELKKILSKNCGKVQFDICESLLRSCFCNDTLIIYSLLKAVSLEIMPDMFNDIKNKEFIYGKYIATLQHDGNCSYGEALKITCFWRECFKKDSFVNDDYINKLLYRAKILEGEALVEKDYKKSILFFCRAAVQGNAEAQFQLGYCLENGWGVKVDCHEALFWYARAAKRRHNEAATSLYRLAEDYYGYTTNQVNLFWDLKKDNSIF